MNKKLNNVFFFCKQHKASSFANILMSMDQYFHLYCRKLRESNN